MPTQTCVRKTLIALGIIEIVLGAGIVISGITCTTEKSRLYHIYHGIWGGAIYAGLGLLAVFAGAKKVTKQSLRTLIS